MVKKYRLKTNKSIVVDAVQWNGNNINDISELLKNTGCTVSANKHVLESFPNLYVSKDNECYEISIHSYLLHSSINQIELGYKYRAGIYEIYPELFESQYEEYQSPNPDNSSGTMKIISGNREQQVRMIVNECAKTGYPIVTHDDVEIRYILKIASEMNVNIPEPITISSMNSDQNRKYVTTNYEKIIIDDAETFVRAVLKEFFEIDIAAIAFSTRDTPKPPDVGSSVCPAPKNDNNIMYNTVAKIIPEYLNEILTAIKEGKK